MFERVPLAEVADLAMGETIIAENCDGQGLPIYSAATNDAPWNHSTRFIRKLKKGTIVVGARGSIGFPRMPADDLFGATQTTITVVARGDSVVPRFLFHVLRGIDFKTLTSQQAIPMLTVAEFGGVSLPRPPINEQGKVVEILDTLDTTSRQTEAIIEKLKQVKQGLLHDLLTRGIDANGELRPPQSQAPHLYKDSPLGWIPREWDALQLRDVGESVTGSTPPSAAHSAWGPGWPFITPVDVLEDHAIDSAERSVSSRGAAYIRLLPPRATLVVCIGSTIGKVGITGVEACTNQQVNALVPSKNMAPEFVHLAVHRHVEQLRAMAGLQAVPIVNKTSFESMVLPIAPLVEQTEIAARMDATSARIRQEEASATKMRALKSGLMDDLLTGRVRVTPLLA
jgi:type I restriction enzyme S subunit